MENWGLRPMGALHKSWPKGANGAPVSPVFIAHYSETDLEAELAANLLAAYDIPVLCASPGDGGFGKVILGMSGTGVDLYAPETLADDARNILSGTIVEETEELE